MFLPNLQRRLLTGSPAAPAPPDDELRELALRARGGELDAAYEILGQQVPVETWVVVIEALERKAVEVDLELVAHRTLRRQPVAVAAAVLRLARAAATPRAGFVARVIAELRNEEKLVSESLSLVSELSDRHSPLAMLTDNRSEDALYGVLSLPLDQQADFIALIRTDKAEYDSLIDALRIEYERLQELARGSRWRSGSYRHVLRHALADLALMAEAGGKLEDQAYRLLQLRTEDPAANRTLLTYIPPGTRTAYLNWALDRPTGKEEPLRTLFVLDEVEKRYRAEVDQSVIQRLVSSSDASIGTAAAEFLIRSFPDESSSDQRIAELISRTTPEERSSLLALIASAAPRRLRLDLWESNVDPQLSALPAHEVLEALVQVLERPADHEARMRALALMGTLSIDEPSALRVACTVLARATEPDADEITYLLHRAPFRAGLWSACEQPDVGFSPNLVAALVDRGEPHDTGTHLAALYRARSGDRAVIEEITLSGIGCDQIAVDAVSGGELGIAIARRASALLGDLEGRLAELRTLAESGDRAAELELAAAIEPLVKRSIERSTGNERLVDDYSRLLAPFPESVEQGSAHAGTNHFDPSEFEAAQKALATAGAHVEVEGDAVTARFDGPVSAATQLRALALAAQRADRASAAASPTARRIVASLGVALARSGLAELALHDLFEGGPLLHPMTSLSPSARDALFEGASSEGFQPPPEWRSHPALGTWITSRSVDLSVSSQRDTDPSVVLTGYQQIERDLRGMEERLAASRLAARQAFFSAVEPVMADIDQTIDANVQLWLGLDRLGICRLAIPGEILDATSLNPECHEIVGDVRTDRYVVRFGGVKIGDDAIRRARVEACE